LCDLGPARPDVELAQVSHGRLRGVADAEARLDVEPAADTGTVRAASVGANPAVSVTFAAAVLQTRYSRQGPAPLPGR
jgi:hypothetical protein